MATPSVQGQIKAQGEVVRRLKKEKAPEGKVSMNLVAFLYISGYFRRILRISVSKSRDGSFTVEEI